MKRKNLFRRLCCVSAALLIVASCAGCGGSGKSGAKKPAEKPDADADDIAFPLNERVTFSVMIDAVPSDLKSKLNNNSVWKKWLEETNVDFDFMFLGTSEDAREHINEFLNAGTYGDLLMGSPILNSITASKYYRAGMFVPLTQYFNEEYMPNFTNRVLKENPEVLKMATAQDGEVICVPRYDWAGAYLESPIWINKVWLDKLHLAVPTTTDELKAVLRAFLDGDPNGNGKQDEIPMMVTKSVNYATFDPWMGVFGMATKSGVNDAYVQVKKGKVEFCPTSNAYKDFLKYFRDLYDNELLYGEAMTVNTSTFHSKLDSDIPVVGVYTYWTKQGLQKNWDEYICIKPPKAPGYEPCWYINPGINGEKNECFVTDKCGNVAVFMKWIDRLFDLDTAMEFLYNLPGEGRMEKDGDKYTVLDMADNDFRRLQKDSPTIQELTMWLIEGKTKDDYANKVTVNSTYKFNLDAYSLYENTINGELWPRPYLDSDDADTVADISTELTYEVDDFFKNALMASNFDIEKEWNGYLKRCDNAGLREYIDALQRAYDAYNK